MANRVTGLRLTQENLHRLGLELDALVEIALPTIGLAVANDAKHHVRRLTGKGADSIKVSGVERHGHRLIVKVGPTKKTAWRLRFLEFGTRKMGAFPFLRPARDRMRHEIKPTLKAKLAKAIRRP